VMNQFTDRQEHAESIGHQLDSQDDSDGDDVAQKLTLDEDISTLIDKVAGNIFVVGCGEHAIVHWLN